MDNREILKGLESEGFYEFITKNYWRMNKEQLKDIIKELDYAAQSEITKSEYKTIKNNILAELVELWEN